jgi:hypothetical protein
MNAKPWASADAIATEEAPVIRRGLAHGEQDRELAAHLLPLPFAAALIGSSRWPRSNTTRSVSTNGRGFAAAPPSPSGAWWACTGGARIGTRLIVKDPGLVLRFISVTAVTSALAAVFAFAPNVPVAIAANIGISIRSPSPGRRAGVARSPSRLERDRSGSPWALCGVARCGRLRAVGGLAR